MSVFGQAEAVVKLWKDYSDIPVETLAQLKQQIADSGIDMMTDKLICSVPETELQGWQEQYSSLIAIAQEELSPFSASIRVPHFFIVTNEVGVVINLEGSSGIIDNINSHHIKPGASFALAHAGINGISLSMHMSSLFVVQGNEHTLQMFEDWTCICLPIHLNNNAIAYVDLSMKKGNEISLAAALLERAAHSIEAKLRKTDPDCSRSIIYNRFEQFGLTSREKEVAYGWLHNQSALQIGMQLGITEGTVRNMLKKVYAKTKVGDKGQFMRRFLR